VLTIMTGEREEPFQAARGFKQKHSITHPLWVDPDHSAARALGLKAYPTNIIIDGQGVVRYHQTGFDGNGLDQTLKAIGVAKAP
jgi:peroxiredoxin